MLLFFFLSRLVVENANLICNETFCPSYLILLKKNVILAKLLNLPSEINGTRCTLHILIHRRKIEQFTVF